MEQRILPSDLWYRSRVLKEPLSHIAAEYGCSKNKIKLIVTSFRWNRGEVVMSRQWMIDRIRGGCTVQDMARENQCAVRTIYGHLKGYGLCDFYKKLRIRGPGNPRLRERSEP